MSRNLVKVITIAVFALPLVVYSAALANSTHDRGNTAALTNDDRYLRCMQTLNQPDFCAARVSSRKIRVVNRESHACMLARRNIARYAEALADLDPVQAKHRRAAAIYRQARGAEVAWYKQRC